MHINMKYDDWSPWLMNTMMLGLNDWICLIKYFVEDIALWFVCCLGWDDMLGVC